MKTKKLLKVTVVLVMLLGILFSISNFTADNLGAAAKWEQLWEWEDGTYDCLGAGQGCVTVTAPK